MAPPHTASCQRQPEIHCLLRMRRGRLVIGRDTRPGRRSDAVLSAAAAEAGTRKTGSAGRFDRLEQAATGGSVVPGEQVAVSE